MGAESPLPTPDAPTPDAPPDEATPARREPPDLALLCSLGVAVVAFLVLVHNLIPARQDLETTLHREEDLAGRARALEAERDDLERREEGLRHDDLYVERVQRKQTRMTRPGEFLVR